METYRKSRNAMYLLRMSFAIFVVVLSLLFGGMQQAMASAIWGSFDVSRINYSAGTLTGSAHSTLRGIIETNNGVIGPSASALTGGYLSGVDVFYTSLLSTSTGLLSGAEQTALQNWIAGGGTLIVTADIFPLPAYESFTSIYGVTNYTSLSNVGVGFPVNTHMITQNVTSYSYNTQSTYTYGADALLLGNDGFGHDFMIVMEPGTGFNAGGRILVFGDHNMFTNTYIASTDNSVLAGNMAQWAAIPEPATLCLLGLGGLELFRRRKSASKQKIKQECF